MSLLNKQNLSVKMTNLRQEFSALKIFDYDVIKNAKSNHNLAHISGYTAGTWKRNFGNDYSSCEKIAS